MTRFRHLFTVVIDGAHTPTSANTRNVSSFDVRSMIRPNTNALNASSPSWSNPSWSYTPANAPHSSNEAVPSTSGSSPAGPVGPVQTPAPTGAAPARHADEHGPPRPEPQDQPRYAPIRCARSPTPADPAYA